MSDAEATETDTTGPRPADESLAVPTSRRGRSRRTLILVLAVILGLGWGVYRVVTWDPNIVIKVHDGETLILQAEQGLLLTGIKVLPTLAPKNHKGVWLGKTARDFTARCVLDKSVTLERGRTPQNEAGWILGYVFVEVDGRKVFVNEELVRRGLAISRPKGLNDKYRDLFDAAEEEARKAQRGVWHPDNAEELRILRGSD